MRILLDENLPIDLRHELGDHACETTAYRGWCGKRNGDLLAAAANAGFDVLLTKDTNLPYQQSARLPLAVVVLRSSSNKLDDIRPLLPAMLEALEDLAPNVVTVVD